MWLFVCNNKNIANLNAGMGDPWAGQIKAIEELCSRSSKLIFLLWTIGGAEPMGSNNMKKVNNIYEAK